MNPYQHRALLVLIGVSATTLALIAFSGAWCAFVSTCGLEGEACDATFWEVFGLGGLSITLLLLIRPLRRRFSASQHRVESASVPARSPSNDCTCEPRPTVCNRADREQRNGGWKNLYAQMSVEEQEQFRKMMQQICTKDDALPVNHLVDEKQS